MVSLLSRDDGSVATEGEMDTGVGDQVSLELSEINVEGTIETERSGDSGDDLGNQTVEVGVSGALDVKVAAADVVHSLVVNSKAAVGVLKHGVGRQNGVVGLKE